MKHLLVTNDFPPKVGGIQNVLWEWWRRLPSDSFAVLTTPHPHAQAFDAEQPFRVERTREPVLLPHPGLVRRVDRMAADFGADFVVLDPALPLGLIGPHLSLPYMVVVHGAEITVPGRLPGSRALLARVLRGARHVIAAGGYPAAEARRAVRSPLDVTVIPPGVDTARFQPLSVDARRAARVRFGVTEDADMVVGVSRLVPRKGFDVLIRAAALIARTRPRLQVVIAGVGRDTNRLQKLIDQTRAPVRLLGRVPTDDLSSLYGCADVSAMICRSRWLGLEQEGFGIVFAEAASCGIPQVAGRSGGAAEAVADGVTGIVVDAPRDEVAVADALYRILDDQALRTSMADASRRRAVDEFDYGVLSRRLADVLGVDR
ncbi:MAG: glycosyltransferase family 4 protein [Ilumatobacteraceae bacterium]